MLGWARRSGECCARQLANLVGGFAHATAIGDRRADLSGGAIAHWNASCSMNACCNGCSAPSLLRQTLDVDFGADRLSTSVRQELIRRPSFSTVQAPAHNARGRSPLPVPVKSRWSRKASSKVVHSATLSSCRSTHWRSAIRANFVEDLDGSVRWIASACQCRHAPLHVVSTSPANMGRINDRYASRLPACLKRINAMCRLMFILFAGWRRQAASQPIPVMARMRSSVGDTSAVAATSACGNRPDSRLNFRCDCSMSANNCRVLHCRHRYRKAAIRSASVSAAPGRRADLLGVT